jgi:trimethylamine--corrinoid protein Co-methyltransferase
VNRPRLRPETPLLQIPFRQLHNPLPPVEILSPEQVENLHESSLNVLENVGLDFFDDEALDIWQKAGARVDHTTRHVWLDRGLVLEAIATAPDSFTWRARNPAHNVLVGGNAIMFGPNGGMVYTSDLERGRRPGTLADFETFLKLSQMCPVMHCASWEQVAPMDIPVSMRHLRRLYASYTLTDKIVMEAAHGREISSDCLEMARITFGDLTAGGPVLGDAISVNSPLRYDDRMLGGLITYARAGQVCIITPFILAGP